MKYFVTLMIYWEIFKFFFSNKIQVIKSMYYKEIMLDGKFLYFKCGFGISNFVNLGFLKQHCTNSLRVTLSSELVSIFLKIS